MITQVPVDTSKADTTRIKLSVAGGPSNNILTPVNDVVSNISTSLGVGFQTVVVVLFFLFGSIVLMLNHKKRKKKR